MSAKSSIIFLLVAVLVPIVFAGQDYYEILGVGRDADTREIRKAFKKLALEHHPDKSKEENAQEKFLLINKAYETLKDEDKRKRYDQFGEEDDENSSQQQQGGRGYQSWNYYHDDFGLYDDDPQIITLDYHDFKRSVRDAYTYWFINFYSPQCGHCHDLAPTWRRLAHKLEGVVRVGAINCQDDFMLCRQQNIRSYPSLIFFGPNGETRQFNGAKEEEDLLHFVVSNLPDSVIKMRKETLKHLTHSEDHGQNRDLPWIISYCSDNDFKCPEKHERRLLAHMLSGMVNVGAMDCTKTEKFCDKVVPDGLGIYYFESYKDTDPDHSQDKAQKLESDSIKDTNDAILRLLPSIPVLDDEKYSKIRIKLEDDIGPPWLIHFVFGEDGAATLHEKRVPSKIGRVKFGKVDCMNIPEACKEMKIQKPQYVVFKVGGGFEYYYGREDPDDVIEFTRISSQANTMTTLTASDFPDIIQGGGVFIDFFAPWCPPCLNLLPEFRKASMLIGGSVVFGSVDCTTYGHICSQFNIRSYPTTIFFNNSRSHYYHGEHSAGALSEFVMEILRPSVMSLNFDDFNRLVGRKPESEMWLVDFFAPWCGPCMQLAPEWTRLAKMLVKMPEVKVAKVDCTAEAELCRQQAVRSYPSLRLYPLGTQGIGRYFVYNGFHRDAYSLREWALEYLPEIAENLTPYTFRQKVEGSERPALIDFYTPWCGHCQRFSPIFDEIALSVRDRVLPAKVNCDRFQRLCAHLGVRAYPTLLFFPGLTDKAKEINDRNHDDVVRFVDNELARSRMRHDEL